MARRIDDRPTLWEALHSQRIFRFDGDKPEERAAKVEEIFRLAREIGGRRREFLARFDYRLAHRIQIADRDGIDREIENCDRLADELHQPAYAGFAARAHAARAIWLGQFDEAEIWMDRALEHGRRADRDIAVLSRSSALRSLRRMQGRHGEMESDLMAVGRLPKNRGHKWAASALLYAETGREADARREFDQLATDGFSRLRRDSNYTTNLALLAETCALLADRVRAEVLYDLMIPHRGLYILIPTIVASGCASRYLALLAGMLDRDEAAQAHFDEALSVERRMGALSFEALTERDYASWLLRRGDPGDAKDADVRLARAERIAGEIGLHL